MTQACYKIGTVGPCKGPLMTFTGNEIFHPNDKIYGHCECDRDKYDRPIVSVRGQCHFLYSQVGTQFPIINRNPIFKTSSHTCL